jgi:hypothetical protein
LDAYTYISKVAYKMRQFNMGTRTDDVNFDESGNEEEGGDEEEGDDESDDDAKVS